MFADYSDEEENCGSDQTLCEDYSDDGEEEETAPAATILETTSSISIAEEDRHSFSVLDCIEHDYLQKLRTFNISHFLEEEQEAKLKFILMDIDIITDRRYGTLAVLFGRVHPSNQSIMVNVSGWYPSMCIEEPAGWVAERHQEILKDILSQVIRKRINEAYPEHVVRTLHSMDCNIIVDIEQVRGTDIMGYSPIHSRDKSFLRLKLASAVFMAPLRESLEGDYVIDAERPWEKGDGISLVIDDAQNLRVSVDKNTSTFNSNFEPVLQFMVDVGIAGCQWCQVPASLLLDYGPSKKSNCDVEIAECKIGFLELVDLDEKSDVGAIRILSFDLEAAGRKGVFPDPAIDPVIQIGIQLQVQGHTSPVFLKPVLLSFKACSDIDGADVFSFDSEASMLKAFRYYILYFHSPVIRMPELVGQGHYDSF